MEGRLEDGALVVRVDIVEPIRGRPLSWTGTNTACAPRKTRRVISRVDAVGGK